MPYHNLQIITGYFSEINVNWLSLHLSTWSSYTNSIIAFIGKMLYKYNYIHSGIPIQKQSGDK